jgi:hypothetical protein
VAQLLELQILAAVAVVAALLQIMAVQALLLFLIQVHNEVLVEL